MSHPWMPFYVADYLADTRRLSTLEHGAYMLLIMEYWQHGSLPTADADLAQVVLLPEREWKRIKPKIAGFFDADWKHGRIDDELAKADAKSEARSLAGARGGKAKGKQHSYQHLNKHEAIACDLNEQNSTDVQASSSQPHPPNPSPHLSALPPDENLGEGNYSQEFEEFWTGLPHTDGQPKSATYKAFQQLSPKDRRAAILSLPAFAEHSRKNPTTRPLRPDNFLAERRFESFAPRVQTAVVFVTRGSPQWSAWVKHRGGKSLPSVRRGAVEGWEFPSEWPPEFVPDASGINPRKAQEAAGQ